MMKSKKAKLLSMAAATALAVTMATPAFASVTDTTGKGDYQGTVESGKDGFDATATIKADVSAPDAKVLSVTIPSTLALPVATKTAADKTVFDADKTPSQTVQVKNNADSDSPVKVSLSKVEESAADLSNPVLSQMVNVLLASEDQPAGLKLARTEAYTDASVLANRIAVGDAKDLTLSASAIAADTVVVPGSYTLKATLKVSMVS